MRKEMIFYGFYLLFPFCFEWMLADLEPCEAQWEGSWVDPAWAGQAWHFHYFQKSRKILSSRNLVQRYFPYTVVVFCFIGMVGGLICDECVCIECVIRQMFSFPDHSGCMSSMALMFHSQWYLSLSHPHKCLSIQENEMPPSSLSQSQSSFQPFSSASALTSLWPNILNYWW